jgi:hypothetical protein
MFNLLAAFRHLPVPTGADSTSAALSGAPAPGFSGVHIAKDQLARPAVLVRIDRPGTGLRPPSIALENLRVEHGLDCRISVPAADQTITGTFSLIQCLSIDDSLQEYFLEIMQVILCSLPSGVTAASVSDAVDALASLFAAAQRPSSRPVQGLWAELFVISRAREPQLLLDSWHSDPMERFDFSLGCQRVEIKCSADRARRHHFSHEQAHPPTGIALLVGSLFVEHSASGTSLGELWDDVRRLAGDNAELRLKIEQVCLQSLGNSWPQARAKSYDQQLAAESLLFFDIVNIPKITADLPLGVSEVRFRSDLGLASALGPDAMASLIGLFSAVLPAS